MSSILTISVTTTHCISITYKRIFISMTYKNQYLRQFGFLAFFTKNAVSKI